MRWWLLLLGAAVAAGAVAGARIAVAWGQAVAEVEQAAVDGWHVGDAGSFPSCTPRCIGGGR